jgi:YD repeat-containing protein
MNRVAIPVTQESHGFVRGTPIFFDGTNWVLATIGGPSVGVVGDLLSQDAFEFVLLGEVTGLDTLVAGSLYYPDGAGGLSLTINGQSVGIAYTDTILHVVNGGSASASTPSTVVDLSSYATNAALLQAIANEVSRANLAYELKSTSSTLVYTGDLLTSVTDAYGTKTFSYDIDGRLTSIVGTGLYPTKTFAYTGDQLTSITVT